MSGECNVCGQWGCVEKRHCAFKNEFDRLETENQRLINIATVLYAKLALTGELRQHWMLPALTECRQMLEEFDSLTWEKAFAAAKELNGEKRI